MAIRHLSDILNETIGHIEKRYGQTGLSGITTGFPSLDEFLDGWQPQLYILGGRPSMGKSALLKDFIMAGARAGRKVHLVNIEDGNGNTVRRMLSTEAGLELWKIRKAKLRRGELEALMQGAGRLAELFITFDDSVCKLQPIIDSIVTAQALGAEVIFIDYLQLIRGNGNQSYGSNRNNEIEEIVTALKGLTKPDALNIPIIVTAQLSRGVESRDNKRPTMADLRDSGAIEQGADVIMFLYRDGYYSKNPTDKGAELILAKGRNEPTGKLNLYFDDLTTTFSEGSVSI